MSFSLYDASIPSQIQVVSSVSKLLDKAVTLCAEQNLSESDITLARLTDDMLPFAYQISSVAGHSIGAIEGLREGVFSPDMTPPPDNFDDLKQLINKALDALVALKPEEVDAFMGKDMQFKMGEFTMDFTGENFLLSFSQPNFYFHATTAYNILRLKGAPIGKIDFLGAARKKA